MNNTNNNSSFGWAPRLGRVLGIEVRIHLTFLLLLGFIGLLHWLPERSGAAALNQLLEREYDARMRRTAGRPLPSGRLQPVTVMLFVACSVMLASMSWNADA